MGVLKKSAGIDFRASGLESPVECEHRAEAHFFHDYQGKRVRVRQCDPPIALESPQHPGVMRLSLIDNNQRWGGLKPLKTSGGSQPG